MFGIIHGTISIMSYFVNSGRRTRDAEKRREFAIKNGYYTYTDRNGRLRLTENNMIVKRDYLPENGDLVYRDRCGTIVRNVYQEQRIKFDKKQKEKAIAKGDTVFYSFTNNDGCNHFLYLPSGSIYTDVETGKWIVEKRMPNGLYYYVHALTGYILRPSDSAIKDAEKSEFYKDKLNRFDIDKYNELRKKFNQECEDEGYKIWKYGYKSMDYDVEEQAYNRG